MSFLNHVKGGEYIMRKVSEVPIIYEDSDSDGFRAALDAFIANPEEVLVVPPEYADNVAVDSMKAERIA